MTETFTTKKASVSPDFCSLASSDRRSYSNRMNWLKVTLGKKRKKKRRKWAEMNGCVCKPRSIWAADAERRGLQAHPPKLQLGPLSPWATVCCCLATINCYWKEMCHLQAKGQTLYVHLSASESIRMCESGHVFRCSPSKQNHKCCGLQGFFPENFLILLYKNT